MDIHRYPDFLGYQHSHSILEDKETSSNNQTSWDVRPLLGLLMPQITFWFDPAVEATDRLESYDIAWFWAISQHSHVILFCHGAFWLIDLGGMSRPQWVY